MAALSPGAAQAETYRDESAGTACQGSNGAASKFTYTMQFLRYAQVPDSVRDKIVFH